MVQPSSEDMFGRFLYLKINPKILKSNFQNTFLLLLLETFESYSTSKLWKLLKGFLLKKKK